MRPEFLTPGNGHAEAGKHLAISCVDPCVDPQPLQREIYPSTASLSTRKAQESVRLDPESQTPLSALPATPGFNASRPRRGALKAIRAGSHRLVPHMEAG